MGLMRECFVLVLVLFFSAFGQSQELKSSDGYLIKSIYFGGGNAYIDQFQKQEIIQFLDTIPNVLSYTISIHSHTDDIGGQAYNAWLSQLRSERTVLILAEYGFNPEAMEIKDFGMLNPIYDNDTFVGRLKNRRVDIIFWPQVM